MHLDVDFMNILLCGFAVLLAGAAITSIWAERVTHKQQSSGTKHQHIITAILLMFCSVFLIVASYSNASDRYQDHQQGLRASNYLNAQHLGTVTVNGTGTRATLGTDHHDCPVQLAISDEGDHRYVMYYDVTTDEGQHVTRFMVDSPAALAKYQDLMCG